MFARSALPLTVRDILGHLGHSATALWLRHGVRSLLGSAAWRGETPSDDRPDRFRRFCQDCGEDTAHEGFDEFGPGWYAQICCCRRCGQQGIRIWPLACW
jgi:hypothetical protein